MRFETLNLPERPRPLFDSLSDFRIERELGDGGFSTVYQATHLETGQVYAIKRIDLSQLYSFNQDNVEHEVQAHINFRHPYVVRLVDFFGEGPLMYLVLEMCSVGSLFGYIAKTGLLSRTEVRRVFEQTLLGVAYVHHQGFIIRDIKPENLLLDHQMNVKLCDFGWCVPLSEDSPYRRMRAGTYAYMSPESLEGRLQDEKSDVWALGILLYELFVGKEPYPGGGGQAEQLALVSAGPPRFPPDAAVPSTAVDLILKALRPNPRDRPSVVDLLRSPFITGSLPRELCSRAGSAPVKKPEKLVTTIISEAPELLPRTQRPETHQPLPPSATETQETKPKKRTAPKLISSACFRPGTLSLSSLLFKDRKIKPVSFQVPANTFSSQNQPRPFHSPSLTTLKIRPQTFSRQGSPVKNYSKPSCATQTSSGVLTIPGPSSKRQLVPQASIEATLTKPNSSSTALRVVQKFLAKLPPSELPPVSKPLPKKGDTLAWLQSVVASSPQTKVSTASKSAKENLNSTSRKVALRDLLN